MSEKQNLGQSKHKKMKLSTILLVTILVSAIIVIGVVAELMYQSNQINFNTAVTNPTPTPIVQPNLTLSTDYVLPTTTTGTPVQFTVTLSNSGGASTVNCLVYFTISENGAIPSTNDVTLQYNDGTTYQTIPLTVSGSNLIGTFGPAGGFPISLGYYQTTQMQVTYNIAGTFSGTAIAQAVS